MVPGVLEIGSLIPKVRWFVIMHPFLDRPLGRDDRLEGVVGGVESKRGDQLHPLGGPTAGRGCPIRRTATTNTTATRPTSVASHMGPPASSAA